MNDAEEKTMVIFRKWNKREGGGILALFPELPADPQGFHCESYESVGGHSGANYQGLVSVLHAPTIPATPEEYAELKEELEGLGYILEIRKRAPSDAYQTRRAALKAMEAPAFIECGSCGAYHRADFHGDCREDAARFEELPEGARLVQA